MPGNDFPLRGQEPSWLPTLDAASQREWRSLTQENDPELYQEAVLSFAGRQERHSQEAVAASIYSSMLEDQGGAETSVTRRARERLAVLSGGGTTGARAEYLLRHLTQELTDPTMILAMGAAGAAFRMTRLATLTRLGAMESGLLTRGMAARSFASFAGFAIEAPAFTVANRLGRAATGHAQDWGTSTLGREFLGSYLTLGAMRFGSAGAGLLQRSSGLRSATSEILFQQTGMLGGILISQGVERRLGWRPAASADVAALDAMMSWLQFNAAGRLAQSALGPRFQAWERSMDQQIARVETVASRPPGEGFFHLPGLAAEPAILGPALPPRSRESEIQLSNVVMMSSSKFGKGSGGLSSPGRVDAPAAETPFRVNDPRDPFFRIEVPRTVQARADRGEGTEFQYRLHLDNFEPFLREGPARTIATRDGREIQLRLIKRDLSKPGNGYLPPGLEGYRFEIREGQTSGDWTIYVTNNVLISFNLTTSKMRPGVGGIVLDWMASQAAATHRQSQFSAIQNLEVFGIIQRRRLIDENTALVEARAWDRRPDSNIPIGRFGDIKFIDRNLDRCFTVCAFPRQGLVPPELRSAVVDRSEGPNAADPYLLHIQALRNFLTPGFEATIAERGDRSIRARVRQSVLVDHSDRFMPFGTPRIALDLSEYENGAAVSGASGGKIDLYVEPQRLSFANLERGGLTPGVGRILFDWVYTQAAARGASVDLLNIKNPRIWDILNQHQFFDPASAQIELGYWDWLASEFQPLRSCPLDKTSPLLHYQPNPFSMGFPVAHLRSQPNPARIPDILKVLRSD